MPELRERIERELLVVLGPRYDPRVYPVPIRALMDLILEHRAQEAESSMLRSIARAELRNRARELREMKTK